MPFRSLNVLFLKPRDIIFISPACARRYFFVEQARLITYHAAMLADQGESITTEAALAKLVASENCNKVCQDAFSIFGGYALMCEFPAQRFLRDSFFPMVGGGTCDIMRLIVSRQIGL